MRGYVSPPLTLTAELEPNTGLKVGSVVTFTVRLYNSGSKAVTVPVAVLPPTGVVWEVVGTPPSAKVTDECSELNGPRCSPAEIRWDPSVRSRQTLMQTVTMRVADFRCPAKGDFHREATITVGGPVARGPNGYTYWTFFENDRGDYISSKGSTPARDWECDVRFAV